MLLRTVCASHTMILRIVEIRLDFKGGPPLLLSFSGALYIWDRPQQININLGLVAWHGFRWYKISLPVSRYKWGMQSVQYRRCLLFLVEQANLGISSRDGLLGLTRGAMLMQLLLKLHIDAFISGQYIESLLCTFIPTTPLVGWMQIA